jgi:feruloyl esterase
MKPTFIIGGAAGIGLGMAFGATTAAAVECGALANFNAPDVLITSAELVSSGTFAPPTGDPITGLPEFCRVQGRLLPHPTSRIKFEVWLPTDSANHRFLQVGNGGFAGNIRFTDLAAGVREGYATASTDDGTSPAPGVEKGDMLTFLGDLDRVADFKGGATTMTTHVAKDIFQLFYEMSPVYSYFTGGSTGGLEALAAVQRTGGEFNGVAAGCPANNSAGLFTQAIWTYRNYQKIGDKVGLIHDAALAACDKSSDGVADGVIGNPGSCSFDPAVLMCTSGDGKDCLTAEQVDAAKAIYAGPVNPSTGTKTGEQYAPGMPIGSEMVWPASEGQALNVSQGWYGMLLNGTLDFDLDTFDFGTDVAKALQISEPHGAQVTDPDLSAFRDRGGKLILYAGWNDPLWSEANLVHYYEQVIGRTGSLADTQSFARLFMVPGMGHCGGGDGVNQFGKAWPDLVNWVENGVPPESIKGSRVVDGATEYTRPLCPYPSVARYSGSGDEKDAANFACVGPS